MAAIVAGRPAPTGRSALPAHGERQRHAEKRALAELALERRARRHARGRPGRRSRVRAPSRRYGSRRRARRCARGSPRECRRRCPRPRAGPAAPRAATAGRPAAAAPVPSLAASAFCSRLISSCCSCSSSTRTAAPGDSSVDLEDRAAQRELARHDVAGPLQEVRRPERSAGAAAAAARSSESRSPGAPAGRSPSA